MKCMYVCSALLNCKTCILVWRSGLQFVMVFHFSYSCILVNLYSGMKIRTAICLGFQSFRSIQQFKLSLEGKLQCDLVITITAWQSLF